MDNAQLIKRLKLVFTLLFFLILIWVGLIIYRDSKFRIVSTDPSTNNVATVTPYFNINFDRQLSSNGLRFQESPSLGSNKYKIEGKTLSFTVSNVLNKNINYKIIIKSIKDTSGQQLSNVSVQFKPLYVSSGSLEQKQQQMILQQQSLANKGQTLAFTGTDGLINNGLSTNQVQQFEQTVIDFVKSQALPIGEVTISQSSITTAPLSGNGTFGLNFNFSIGTTNYSTSMVYSGLDTAQVTIYSSSGTQLYQAGSVSSGSATSSNTNQ